MVNINIGTMQSKIYFKDCRVKVIRFKNRIKIDRDNKAGFALRYMTWSGPSYLVRTRMKAWAFKCYRIRGGDFELLSFINGSTSTPISEIEKYGAIKKCKNWINNINL